MKTYKTTIEKPRLKIMHDDGAFSPREVDGALGYFITVENRYQCPDDNSELRDIIEETQHEANNANEHMKLVKKQYVDATGEQVLHIEPVTRFEHGLVAYRRGASTGFDSSHCGFYVVTDKTLENTGLKAGELSEEQRDKIIDSELAVYTQYVNGDVYYAVLYDENGNVEEACGNLYDIEDVRDFLPSEEWSSENMHDYLVY